MSIGKVDFSKGSIKRNIFSMALPMLIAQLVSLLYNIVDRIYIGNLPGDGELALSGLGVCFPLITLNTGFANLFGLGGAPLFSIARGRGDRQESSEIMHNAFGMLLVIGFVLMAVGLVFLEPILRLFGASDATYPYASDYMRLYLLGTCFSMISLGMNPYINNQGFRGREC